MWTGYSNYKTSNRKSRFTSTNRYTHNHWHIYPQKVTPDVKLRSFTQKVNTHKLTQRQLAIFLECQPEVCVPYMCMYCVCVMALLTDSSGVAETKLQKECVHVFVHSPIIYHSCLVLGALEDRQHMLHCLLHQATLFMNQTQTNIHWLRWDSRRRTTGGRSVCQSKEENLWCSSKYFWKI